MATAPEFEEGYLIQENEKYAILKQYIDLLNKSPLSEERYELGHEISVATKQLQLLKENYTPKDTPAGQRQSKLIDQAIKASAIIDKIDDITLSKIQTYLSKQGVKLTTGGGFGSVTTEELDAVLRAAGEVMDLEVTVEKNLTEKFGDQTLKIALRPELESLNQYTGKLTGALSKSVGAAIRSNSSKAGKIDEVLKQVDVYNLSGSPSITDIVIQTLDAAFFESKKKPNKRMQSKVRVHRRIPANNTEAKNLKKIIKRRTLKLKAKIEAQRKKKKFIIPTITLKAIINEALAEYIKNRMGKSMDPAIQLRYQTGRFSESARLLTLNRTETGALIGTYDFMKDPYGTFLPGGRLHTQQRDPKIYIESAIRDIAVQVLKNQFNGIALELT